MKRNRQLFICSVFTILMVLTGCSGQNASDPSINETDDESFASTEGNASSSTQNPALDNTVLATDKTSGYPNDYNYRYVYNEYGEKIAEYQFSSNGSISNYTVYEYDSDGRVVREASYDIEQYDISTETLTLGDDIETFKIYEYSNDGSCICRDFSHVFGRAGVITILDDYNLQSTHFYDAEGNEYREEYRDYRVAGTPEEGYDLYNESGELICEGVDGMWGDFIVTYEYDFDDQNRVTLKTTTETLVDSSDNFPLNSDNNTVTYERYTYDDDGSVKFEEGELDKGEIYWDKYYNILTYDKYNNMTSDTRYTYYGKECGDRYYHTYGYMKLADALDQETITVALND